MWKYKCYFRFAKRYLREDSAHTVIGSGFFDFTKGFWINEDLEFTRGADSRYWIPVSQILLVEKIKEDENDGE
jgi:hypothetical protein